MWICVNEALHRTRLPKKVIAEAGLSRVGGAVARRTGPRQGCDCRMNGKDDRVDIHWIDNLIRLPYMLYVHCRSQAKAVSPAPPRRNSRKGVELVPKGRNRA